MGTFWGSVLILLNCHPDLRDVGVPSKHAQHPNQPKHDEPTAADQGGVPGHGVRHRDVQVHGDVVLLPHDLRHRVVLIQVLLHARPVSKFAYSVDREDVALEMERRAE